MEKSTTTILENFIFSFGNNNTFIIINTGIGSLYNSMEIIHFDYHNSQKFISLKNYLLIPTTFDLFWTIRNAKCISITDGIICGFIVPDTKNKKDSLRLFSIDPNSDYNKN